MEKIDELRSPPIVGKMYLVPCIIENKEYDIEHMEFDDGWEHIRRRKSKRVLEITPIINHLHNDKENGQPYYHYHTDYRFVVTIKGTDTPKKLHSSHRFGHIIRYNLGNKQKPKIEYHPLKCIRTDNMNITHASLIKRSKLKHDCIFKGKCPHRGYNLSQEVPDSNGVITCPLHGLKFNKDGRLLDT